VISEPLPGISITAGKVLRCEALMQIWIVVFWAVIPCSLVGGYQHFGGMYHLHPHLQDYMVSQPKAQNPQRKYNSKHSHFPTIIQYSYSPIEPTFQSWHHVSNSEGFAFKVIDFKALNTP
jgi:hypothetical protein